MRAAVDPAPAKEQRTRWLRRNAAETAPVPEPASAPVQGPKPEVALAAAPPSKRKRADDDAANGEVVDFCDIFGKAHGLPRGHNVASSFNVRPETPAPNFLPSPLNVTFRRGELAVQGCSVYNLGNKNDSRADAPEISISEEQYVERGEPVTLHCNATGQHYTPDEIDRFRNGKKVTSEKHSGIKLFKHLSITHKTFTSILSIDKATMEDNGVYVCRASNVRIANTKVHVLNGKNKAETSNKKRGTYHDGYADEQVSSGHMKSSASTIREVTFTYIILCILLMFNY
ncbi:uncharacterized protein LOC127844043 isoform X6 [Dreissena polymorpha]|uniref:uncharacterized protein LOC127844043 isoform X2 n=1 Tax=Dreissena polymorpha TaxID=45954 RepID=UPI0022656E56|nr:uncharacterized protein LOC127844043 isoform X2 [Dreissena polymorpha]XP_052229961.1 uncharacterized protein LOC127844043 isoform X3 [Dreissena polymorpha]XP_052229962.1 uncharacterized protein LOC127844043 isoform X4 [Dreissena polymorpha]XP_052229963.1 uncharacterized protein LOC127844043 isoform X5 [Dreissena polymorpha]XP_052229964.1 uncharacterized protein LOC127844043 isoform X6 [Dreissena polymorpha]